MTDNHGANTPTTNPWGEAWVDAQRKYFDTWIDLTRRGTETLEKGFKPEATPTNPFLNGVEQWWKMMSPMIPEENRQVTSRLMEMNKGYMQMGEQVWNLAQGMQATMKAGQDWRNTWQEQIKNWQQQWNTPNTPAVGWNTLWGLPLQHWQQLSSSYSIMPGDLEKILRGGGPLGADTLQNAIKSFLSTPPVGYTREMQEDWQELARLWLEQAQAVQKYESLLMGVGNRTTELVGTQLMAMMTNGKSIESLRQAYDLWVDCAEMAYAELAQGNEFITTQAKLTNTLMAVKRKEQQMIEPILRVFDLPTRSELNTAHKRIHSLRRELGQLQRRLDDFGVEDLHGKIDQLRAEVRNLMATTSEGTSVVSDTTTSTARRSTRATKGTTDINKNEG